MKKNVKGLVIATVVTAVIGFIINYVTIPVYNIQSQSFWGLILFLFVLFLGTYTLFASVEKDTIHMKKARKSLKVLVVVVVLWFVAMGIGNFFSSKLVASKTYANILDVKDGNFEKDIPEVDDINKIALMDTASARIIGNRTLGDLSDIVSQYEISQDYTQICIEGAPEKVAALEYVGFIKYFKNKSKGIPGYVMVDPVNNSADYVKLDTPMKYVPSGFFGDNLQREVRRQYPTKMIDGYYFEVDNEGSPYYICPVITYRAGLFGGKDISSVIIFDPCDGSSKVYDVDEVPTWVDHVYSGELITTQYDNYGTLQKGYWNSVYGNTGCKITTEDYGYIALEDDIYVYTGVTSVNADESNIGFIMVNARTAEAKYFAVSGAEEFSAMDSAEGEVQEKGYVAAFPSLINVSDQPTYIMALKDAAGLVKMYALVNVERYNLVAVATTKTEALKEYKKLLRSNDVSSGDESDSLKKTFAISDIKYIVTEGETVIYVYDEEGIAYKQAYLENEELMTLKVGDNVTMTYEDSAIDKIKEIVEFKVN